MKNKYTRIVIFTIVIFIVINIYSCLPGPNIFENKPDDLKVISGFWEGFYHGAIAPITFVLSLFLDGIHIYEIHNNGAWYNLGFLFGADLLAIFCSFYNKLIDDE